MQKKQNTCEKRIRTKLVITQSKTNTIEIGLLFFCGFYHAECDAMQVKERDQILE